MNSSLKNACLALTLCAATTACADSGQSSTGRFSALTSLFSGLKLSSSVSCSQFLSSCQNRTSSLFTSARSKYNEPISSNSEHNTRLTKGNVLLGGSLLFTGILGWRVWAWRNKKSQLKNEKLQAKPENTLVTMLGNKPEVSNNKPTELPTATTPVIVRINSKPIDLSTSSVASTVEASARDDQAPITNQYGLTQEEVAHNMSKIWSEQALIESYLGGYEGNARMAMQHARQHRDAFNPENLAAFKQSQQVGEVSLVRQLTPVVLKQDKTTSQGEGPDLFDDVTA